MGLFQAIFLGLIQGLTEFFPISSSGHLAITQYYLKGFRQPGLLFDVAVHLGTLFALTVYFRREIYALLLSLKPGNNQKSSPKGGVRDQDEVLSLFGEQPRQFLLKLVLASLPTAVIGYLLRNLALQAFQSITTVALFLGVTGLVVFLGARTKRRKRGFALHHALIIGAAQGLAVLPGLSRSGLTIASGMFCGLEGRLAARFSFLLAIPAILGAGLIEFKAISALPPGEYPAYAAGMAMAALSGYAAIKLVLVSVTSRNFGLFGVYCLIAGSGIYLSRLLTG
ncbi:MAG: undecaprenyl-diphosphate phosphatase [Thermodesulfobacteriota bacterium]